MLQLVVDRSALYPPPPPIPPETDRYGAWTDYSVPEDRSGWHGLVRDFYEYWLSITPPGRLPGRQHVAPEDLRAMLSRLSLVDVYRGPLRYRYRVCGTAVVHSLGREVTGAWLDEAHPELLVARESRERFRFMVETRTATWRRGAPLWKRTPEHSRVESCIVPLARDGRDVDQLFGILVTFDRNGKPI